MEEFDILIQNATILEGTGKEAYKGSIGVAGDKVSAIDKVKGDAKKVIDAKDLIALPGFIDAHSHADGTLLHYPMCESFVMQGMTTFVGGQCGGSMAPLGDYIRVPPMLMDHLPDLDPYKYYPNQSYYQLEQINEWMYEIFGWTLDWKTMAGFFKRVEDKGISMNLAPLIGHGTIRTKVMGLDYKRHSTYKEQAQMRELIKEAMEDGCIGMSTGLDYDPDVFATHEEIIDGVKVLTKYNGVYCPHWRRTGRRRGVAVGHVPNEKITGLMECVDVYKRTGVRLHLAHLVTGFEVYPNFSEEMEEANLRLTIDMITRDSKGELDITWDSPSMVRSIYGGWTMPYLCSLLQPWLRELGGREALGKWLKVKDFREEVKDAIRRGLWYIRVGFNPNTNPRWAENIIVVKSKSPGLDGKSIAVIASEREADSWDTYFDIITEDPDTHGLSVLYPVKDCYDLFYSDGGMVGLDSRVYDDKYQQKNPPYRLPSWASFSIFPWFFIKYVRDGNLFNLNEAVQKTSTLAARVHNLEGRGVICKGSYADIVLMDLQNLKILGDSLEPRRYPKGIEYVLVNGVAVVEKGEHTGRRPGRVLKRKA